MSVKLYEQDVYQQTFNASVTAVKQDDEERYHVALDATAFYPEGGGQPSDRGVLAGQGVSHVYEDAGIIWHVVDAPLTVGTAVEGEIDWPRRFHFMQQHLGQHIVSAVFETLCGAETASVHFGEELSTIDLSLPVTPDQMEEVERRCNDVIYANMAVEINYPDPASIPETLRRKVPDTHEPLRIVKVGEIDLIACCGTHPARTGEVGIIKLFRSENYKGGVRLTFACGGAALHKLAHMWRDVQHMQRTLSVADTELAARVEKLQADCFALDRANRALQNQLLAAQAEGLIANSIAVGAFKLVVYMADDTSRNTLKSLLHHLALQVDTVAVLGALTDEGGLLMMGTHKSEKRFDLRPLFADCLTILGGKGGGGSTFCQGMGGNEASLQEAMKHAQRILVEQLASI